MKTEKVVLHGTQRVTAHQAEIRYIFLHFPAIAQAVILAVAELESRAAQVPVLGHTMPKARIAGAKNGAKDAIAGDLPVVAADAHSITMAMRTGGFCQRDCL